MPLELVGFVPTLQAKNVRYQDAIESFRKTSLNLVFSSGSRRQKRRGEMEVNGRVGHRQKKILEIDFVGKVEIARRRGGTRRENSPF